MSIAHILTPVKRCQWAQLISSDYCALPPVKGGPLRGEPGKPGVLRRCAPKTVYSVASRGLAIGLSMKPELANRFAKRHTAGLKAIPWPSPELV